MAGLSIARLETRIKELLQAASGRLQGQPRSEGRSSLRVDYCRLAGSSSQSSLM